MQINEMNYEDVSRSYSGTYLGYKHKRKLIPFYVDQGDVVDDETCMRGTLHKPKHGGELACIKIHDPNLVYKLPDSRMFFSHGALFSVIRSPRRQWRRGLCLRTMSVAVIVSEKRTLRRRRITDVSPREIHDLYNPEYNKKRGTRLLSDRAAIKISQGAELLVYLGMHVGIVEDGEPKLFEEFSYLDYYYRSLM